MMRELLRERNGQIAIIGLLAMLAGLAIYESTKAMHGPPSDDGVVLYLLGGILLGLGVGLTNALLWGDIGEVSVE